MDKIVIVGCGGAGKSTLARELGKLLNLPVFHLDAQLWKSGWVMSSREEENVLLQKIIEQKKWIIDGNYGATMPVRFAAADTIIFLDFSRWICMRRVIKRWWQYRGKSRPDMAQNCPERLDVNFLKWIWNYRRTSRTKVLQTINLYKSGRKVIILCRPQEITRFLQLLK